MKFKINDQLKIPFKGDRDYIHSTDIFNAVRLRLDYGVQIDFQLNTLVTHPVRLISVDESELSEIRLQSDYCGRLVYHDMLEKKSFLVILQDLDNDVDMRIPYDEGEIINGYEIFENSINHVQNNSRLFIERVVALNKQLLNHAVEKKSWFFTRIELIDLHINSESLNLKIDPISSSRIFKTTISTPSRIIGNIYFV